MFMYLEAHDYMHQKKSTLYLQRVLHYYKVLTCHPTIADESTKLFTHQLDDAIGTYMYTLRRLDPPTPLIEKP